MLKYVDTNALEIWERKNARSPVLRWRFTRGSTPSLQFQFVTNGAVVELADAAATGTLGFKTNKTDASYLIPAVSWTKTGSGAQTTYTFTPTFLATALDTLMGDNDSVAVWGELKWVDGSNTNVITFPVRIAQNLNRGDETIPTSPSAFLPLTPSAAGNSDVSAAGGIAVVSVIASAGAGAYTYTVSLVTTGVPTGAMADVYIELPASGNPTIEVHNASSAGTLLHTVSGDTDNATYQNIRFRFNGTAWVKFTP